MRSRIIKIMLACCVFALVAFWSFRSTKLAGLAGLKDWETASASRFEGFRISGPMSKSAGGVHATTDRYLSPLRIPNPSEAMLKAMADVPPEDAMVFITSNAGEESELVYRTVAYLGWPRPIGEARCGVVDEAPELLFQPRAGRPIKWLFFYRVNPPAELTQTSRMIGPHLALTSSPELKEWKSYCSR